MAYNDIKGLPNFPIYICLYIMYGGGFGISPLISIYKLDKDPTFSSRSLIVFFSIFMFNQMN